MLDVHILFIFCMASIVRFFLLFHSSLESKSIPSFLLFFHSPFVPSLDRVSVFPLFFCKFQEARVFSTMSRSIPSLLVYVISIRYFLCEHFFLMSFIAASKYVVERTGLSPSPCGTPMFAAKMGLSSFFLALSLVPFKRKFTRFESSGEQMLSITFISFPRFTVSKADDRSMP